VFTVFEARVPCEERFTVGQWIEAEARALQADETLNLWEFYHPALLNYVAAALEEVREDGRYKGMIVEKLTAKLRQMYAHYYAKYLQQGPCKDKQIYCPVRLVNVTVIECQ
jgi:hypothetical protein